jgi:xanthine dehydrogenase molybdenum-binding subunit
MEEEGGNIMIPFDFEYYRPDTVMEAVELFHSLDSMEKEPVYFSGGTEIITMARRGDLYTGAVIDIKHIRECKSIENMNGTITIGSAVSLNSISQSNVFPLLGLTAGRAADHTVRGKLTVGGNICGRIIYREAVLPFLLADSLAVIAGMEGLRTIPINSVFDGKLKLNRGELLVSIITDEAYAAAPFESFKRTRQESIDYPLVTAAALKKDGYIRAAFSGICSFPFRSQKIEEDINKEGISAGERAEIALSHLPASIMSGISGSAPYRAFVFKNVLTAIIKKLEVEQL